MKTYKILFNNGEVVIIWECYNIVTLERVQDFEKWVWTFNQAHELVEKDRFHANQALRCYAMYERGNLKQENLVDCISFEVW